MPWRKRASRERKIIPNLSCIKFFPALGEANMQKNNTNEFYYKTLGFSICRVTMRNHLHGFALHGIFARISERIFCTDFLHGFFARIFCRDFLHGFLRGFLRVFCARIFVKICSRILCTDFLGCPKPLARKRQHFTEKIPPKFTMLWGPSGEVRWRQEGEVETLANLTKPRVSEDWGGLGWHQWRK